MAPAPYLGRNIDVRDSRFTANSYDREADRVTGDEACKRGRINVRAKGDGGIKKYAIVKNIPSVPFWAVRETAPDIMNGLPINANIMQWNRRVNDMGSIEEIKKGIKGSE